MPDEDKIRVIVEEWARAVAADDRRGVLASHSPGLLMYDFPDTRKGIDPYDQQWDFFYLIFARTDQLRAAPGRGDGSRRRGVRHLSRPLRRHISRSPRFPVVHRIKENRR